MKQGAVNRIVSVVVVVMFLTLMWRLTSVIQLSYDKLASIDLLTAEIRELRDDTKAELDRLKQSALRSRKRLDDRGEWMKWVTQHQLAGTRWTYEDEVAYCKQHGMPPPKKPKRKSVPPTAWKREYEEMIQVETNE